jgi:hypothetical protein
MRHGGRVAGRGFLASFALTACLVAGAAPATADEAEVRADRLVIDAAWDFDAQEFEQTHAIAAENARACATAQQEPDPEAQANAFAAVESVAKGNEDRLRVLHDRARRQTKRYAQAVSKKANLDGLKPKRKREVIEAGADLVRGVNKLLGAVVRVSDSGKKAVIGDCAAATADADTAQTEFFDARVDVRLGIAGLRP